MMSLLDVAAVIFIIAVLIIVFLTAFPKVVLFFIMLFYATFGTEELGELWDHMPSEDTRLFRRRSGYGIESDEVEGVWEECG
jgi:hypothetical protein